MAERRLPQTNEERKRNRIKQRAQGSKGNNGSFGDPSGLGTINKIGDSITNSVGVPIKNKLIDANNGLNSLGDSITNSVGVPIKEGLISAQNFLGNINSNLKDKANLARQEQLRVNNILDSNKVDTTPSLSDTTPDVGNTAPTQDQGSPSDNFVGFTSQRTPNGTQFNFGNNSVTTNSGEAASRLANGQGLRGGQVSTINIDNFRKASKAESVQKIIAEGKRLGRSPGDILSLVREFENSGQPTDRLQAQLDQVNELERLGAINPAIAQSRRNKLNLAFQKRDELNADTQSNELSQTNFDRQQAVREGRLGVEQNKFELNKAKAIAKDLRDSKATKLEKIKTYRQLLNDPNGKLSLQALAQTEGPLAIFATSEGTSEISKLKQDLREFQDPADKRDLLVEAAGRLGLAPELVQEALTFDLRQ